MDETDAYNAYKRVGNRGNKYMDSSLNLRFSQQRQGNPFDIPDDIDELELMVGWFFDRLRVIVSVENHSQKFDGIRQVIDILHDAAAIENNSVKFAWVDGQWFISYIDSKKDVLNLPKVLRRFSKIYRFAASDYVYGDNESIQFLPSGKMGGLSTKQAEEELKRRTGL